MIANQNRSSSDDWYARWLRGKCLTAAVTPVVVALRPDRARAMALLFFYFVSCALFFCLRKIFELALALPK